MADEQVKETNDNVPQEENTSSASPVVEKDDTETKKELSAKDAAKVKKQIEFYFSDSNYPKDKFLQETAKQHKEGFIPLSVLTTFNRLKEITTDLDQIRNALADSTGLYLIFVSLGG